MPRREAISLATPDTSDSKEAVLTFYYKHYWSNYKHYVEERGRTHNQMGFLLAFATLLGVINFSLLPPDAFIASRWYFLPPAVGVAILVGFLLSIPIRRPLMPWLDEKELKGAQGLADIKRRALIDLFKCINDQERYYRRVLILRLILVALTPTFMLTILISPLLAGKISDTLAAGLMWTGVVGIGILSVVIVCVGVRHLKEEFSEKPVDPEQKVERLIVIAQGKS